MDMAPQADEVAVIIPNYNKKKTLRACLESVYAQTYRPAEVIVVDDGSTDGSLEIAREFPCRIITSPGNQGSAAARNIGAVEATVPLLFFLDSDTALAPDAIENAVRAYRQTPGAGMVQGVYAPEPLYDDGLVEQYRVAFEHFDRRQSTATFLSNTLIPKHVFFEAGGLDERLRDGEDFEFGTRVPARYRLVVTEAVVTRADDVDGFWACLWERFVRASTHKRVHQHPTHPSLGRLRQRRPTGGQRLMGVGIKHLRDRPLYRTSPPGLVGVHRLQHRRHPRPQQRHQVHLLTGQLLPRVHGRHRLTSACCGAGGTPPFRCAAGP